MAAVRRWIVGAVLVACGVGLTPLGVLATAPPADPLDDPLDDGVQNPGAVIEVPVGCPLPDPAAVVFVGTVVDKDFRTGRFRIDQLRAGSASDWSVDGLIDVRYGPDAQYLDVGGEYLVGAGVDPVVGVLSSRVTPPAAVFGGDQIVGVDDVDIECPVVDDPIRTLNVDGSSVESSVLQPLFAEPRKLLAAWLVPIAAAFGVLIALIVLKRLVVLWFAGIFALGRSAVTPAPDHRAVRLRSHGAVTSGDQPDALPATLDDGSDVPDAAGALSSRGS